MPDGGLVAAGSACKLPRLTIPQCGLALVRYGPAGNELKRTPSDFAGGENLVPGGVAVDSQGRIVVGGRYFPSEESPALIGYLPDGSVDPRFSSATVFSDRFPLAMVGAVAIDAQDRIVVAGRGAAIASLFIGRLLPSGAFDPSFGGGDGVAEIPGYSGHGITDLVIAPGGGIFLSTIGTGGENTLVSSLSALGPDGTLRTDFDVSRKFRVDAYIRAVALDSRARILALVGPHHGRPFVVRLSADGRLDRSFGKAGLAGLRKGEGSVPSGIAVDSLDRALVVAGRFRVIRFTPSGQRDHRFAPDGVAKASFGKGFWAYSLDMLLDSAGRIVVAGQRDPGKLDPLDRNPMDLEGQFALARFGYPACRTSSATVIGTPGDDHLIGTAGRDVVLAGGGNDRVSAGDGNDLICAGAGEDVVFAGAGRDGVYGGGGMDRLYGQAGFDRLFDRRTDLLRLGPQ
ncbi:MAG TPA: hypothetical protein VEW07_04550 [Solirubrobacterales bacterium]|nr:hypothetical protein [Solirubrobacterales bacterium]